MFENLRLLDGHFQASWWSERPVWGVSTIQEQEIENIARMAGGLKRLKYFQLIPYHGLAKVKYDALGEEFAAHCAAPPPERIKALEDLAAAYVKVFNQNRGFCVPMI